MIAGESSDEIYEGYRLLTGATQMLPKAAYGYIQSKAIYPTQDQILDVAKEYRQKKLPLDYLSACALLYTGTGDEDIRSKANDLVAGMALCQAKDGYLGAYPAHPTYDRLRARQRVWAPFYTYHKILAGLLDMNQLAGNQQALTMAMRMADWADQWSSPIPADEFQLILMEEQGGISEALFNLYGITGQTQYKDAAVRFEHRMILDPLANNKDMLAGNHANTNIPKVIGAARAYELTGEPRYKAISENFHRMVVEHHSYCTGGTSD